MEAEHEAMDLEARSGIHSLYTNVTITQHYSVKEDQWYHTLHIPPSPSSFGRASNSLTSRPWPTQCAADDTPVRPVPMIAILGWPRPWPSALGGGGVGEKSRLRTFCSKIYKMVNKCWIGAPRRDQLPWPGILVERGSTDS
jgi:hypothetical protein